jgi:hypothetical protein
MCAPSTPSQTTQTTDLPDWAKPYAKDAMAKGAALTDVNQNPYQTYGGERIAGFTPMQQQAQQSAANMQPSQQLGLGSGLAGAAGMGAMNTNYQAGQFNPNQVQAPNLQNYQMQEPQNVQAPNLQNYQMQGPQNVRTQSFANPYSAQAYMSPYMQNVVDIQQREAQRAADVAKTGRNAQAVGAGAFGGSRQAIMDAEAERNLATQKGDIQAQGLQSAYGQAQGQFNAEQQARLQAQMANQQAGINVGGQNLNALLGVQQLGAGQNLQSQLANQQAGINVGGQNLSALLGVQQLGAGQNLQSQLANQQAGMTAQQLGEQSRQYGAGLGMQGLQTGLQAAGQLGQLGQTQYGQEMGINQLQNQYGAQQQQQQQRGLDTAYQDFLNQQNYPYKQLGFMSDLIRGLPLGQKSTAQTYEAPGSLLGQLGGLGMGAYGLSKMGAFAEGGLAYAGGGVTDPQNVENILSKLSDAQLQQAKKAALDRRDINEAQMIDAEIAQRATMRQGIAPAISDQFANDMEQSMATGGIVAFADRGVVTEGDNYSHEGMRKPDSINMPKPKAGIPDAVKQAVPALAQQTGVPEEDLMARVPGLMDMFQKQYAPLIEQQRAMVEQSKPDTEAMKQQGLAQALTQFGFKMAANAARPNARFLESASAAAPEISTAVQDMNKLMSVKQDNYNKLKMDQMKYENALQIGNMKDATLLAGQIRQAKQADKQIGMQQDQLAEQIRHSGVSEKQASRQLDIMAQNAATAAANKPETITSLSDLLANANPEQRKNIEAAARLKLGTAADIRADASTKAALSTELEKIATRYPVALRTGNSDTARAYQKSYENEVARAYSLYNMSPQDMAPTSGASTGAPGASSSGWGKATVVGQ